MVSIISEYFTNLLVIMVMLFYWLLNINAKDLEMVIYWYSSFWPEIPYFPSSKYFHGVIGHSRLYTSMICKGVSKWLLVGWLSWDYCSANRSIMEGYILGLGVYFELVAANVIFIFYTWLHCSFHILFFVIWNEMKVLEGPWKLIYQ